MKMQRSIKPNRFSNKYTKYYIQEIDNPIRVPQLTISFNFSTSNNHFQNSNLYLSYLIFHHQQRYIRYSHTLSSQPLTNRNSWLVYFLLDLDLQDRPSRGIGCCTVGWLWMVFRGSIRRRQVRTKKDRERNREGVDNRRANRLRESRGTQATWCAGQTWPGSSALGVKGC